MSKSYLDSIRYAVRQRDDLEVQRQERLKQLKGTDPLQDLEYVKIRLSQEVNERQLFFSNAEKMAARIRTKNHKDLGKQYGIASREIARLKGEIALLKLGENNV